MAAAAAATAAAPAAAAAATSASADSPSLISLLAAADAGAAPYHAIEFFPPRTPEGLAHLYERAGRLVQQRTFVGWVGVGGWRVG